MPPTGVILHIAILEDDTDLAVNMGKFLSMSGHTSRIFKDGQNLISAVSDGRFDMFVLDWHVPIMSGLEVLKTLRGQYKVTRPVIFLTSVSDELQMAKALNMGADDYWVKPVQLNHFIQRLTSFGQPEYEDRDMLDGHPICGYHFDSTSNTVRFNLTSVTLNERDFVIAKMLFKRIGRPVSRHELLNSIWGTVDSLSSKELDQHIFRIKQLLNLGVYNQSLRLTSITGFGFRLNQIFLDD